MGEKEGEAAEERAAPKLRLTSGGWGGGIERQSMGEQMLTRDKWDCFLQREGLAE